MAGTTKQTKRPIGIDLFSGAGGLSLGFEQAGFDVLAAVEVDPIHAAIHKFNFPECAVLPRSISALSGKEIRKSANVGNRRIDVVFGGPPCQGFSMIGRRALDDPRNELVRDFVRIVVELDASYFVFENVKGLTVGKQRAVLDELIAEFKRVGYHVRLPWQVLNVARYGVPQDRKRLILLGAKRNLPLPEYPKPTTRFSGDPDELPMMPTCHEALGDLPNAERFRELQDRDSVRTDRWGEPSAYARELRTLGKNAWRFGYQRIWDRTVLTSSMRTEHTDISRRRFAETIPGNVEPVSRLFKLARAGISNTLRAGTDSARGAFTSPRPIHYKFARCVTVREMARLHGFPDWFRFHVTKWHGARQIGNAVPPPLARVIASVVIDALGIEPQAPGIKFALGDPKLLQLDMSQAAEYWGVPAPIGRRDRKSGAKKRKQVEIEAIRLALASERACA